MRPGSRILLVLVLALFAVGAVADTLTLTSPAPADQQYQQTLNSPCIYGDPSCHQPSGFNLTNINDGGSLQNFGVGTPLESLHYSYDDIVNAIGGSNFIVGIDVNQAKHLSPTLTYFAEVINGTVVASFGVAGSGTASDGQSLVLTNNGNGYADAILAGFVAPNPGDTVWFELTYLNANDGTEEFFLINTSAPPPTVPEPSSLALLGTGLVSAAGAIRRRFFA